VIDNIVMMRAITFCGPCVECDLVSRMASTRRDLQRYRKVYPFYRRPPRYVYTASSPLGDDVVLEVGEIVCTATDTATYNFTESFTSAPSISGIAVDTTVTGDANVNVYVDTVSTSQVIFRTSAHFTGKISFQAIQVLT